MIYDPPTFSPGLRSINIQSVVEHPSHSGCWHDRRSVPATPKPFRHDVDPLGLLGIERSSEYSIKGRRIGIEPSSQPHPHITHSHVTIAHQPTANQTMSDDSGMKYCSLCDQYFLTKELLYQHMQYSTRHPHCKTCKRSFLNMNSLRNVSTLLLHSIRN
jgi:hypothetical protein